MVSKNYQGKVRIALEGDADISHTLLNNGHSCIIRYEIGKDEERLAEKLYEWGERFDEPIDKPIRIWLCGLYDLLKVKWKTR